MQNQEISFDDIKKSLQEEKLLLLQVSRVLTNTTTSLLSAEAEVTLQLLLLQHRLVLKSVKFTLTLTAFTQQTHVLFQKLKSLTKSHSMKCLSLQVLVRTFFITEVLRWQRNIMLN